MRQELIDSGRTLDRSDWVEKVVQGEATPEELVGWARQHYWGVTYHTRRFLSVWVARMPYEMTDAVIENIGEEVLGIQSKSGHEPPALAVRVHPGARRAGQVITEATPNVDAVACESFLYNLALQRPWYEVPVRRRPGHREPDPPAYTRVVEGFQQHYADVLSPDDYAFHTIHIYVDEEHGGGVGEFAERYLDTEDKRRSARSAYLTGAELTRRCWDALDGATW